MHIRLSKNKTLPKSIPHISATGDDLMDSPAVFGPEDASYDLGFIVGNGMYKQDSSPPEAPASSRSVDDVLVAGQDCFVGDDEEVNQAMLNNL